MRLEIIEEEIARSSIEWLRLEAAVETLLEKVSTSVLGARLRRSRLRQGLSIRDLAGRANVSKNSVVRVEHGGGAHNLTILKLCKALGLHVATLAEPSSPESGAISAVHRLADDRWFDLTDFGAGPLENRPLTQHERAALARDGVSPLLILKSRLDAGRLLTTVIELYQETEVRSHAGEEFVYVLEGSAKIKVGFETHVLNAGESVVFWSAEEHSYAPADPKAVPARVLSVRIDDKPDTGRPSETV